MRTHHFAMLAGLVVATVTACSSPATVETVATGRPASTAGLTATAPSVPSPTTKDAKPALEAYMKAFSAYSDPEQMRTGLQSAAAGSPAYVYLSHQANVSEANLDAGFPNDDSRLTVNSDGSFENCAPDDAADCSTFSDFKADKQGKLVEFTVDGKEIRPRLIAGAGTPVKMGTARLTFLSAYQAASSNSLLVTLKVETGAKSLELWNGQYRSVDGKTRDVADILSPQKIEADSNAMVMVAIPGMKPGGKLSLMGLAPGTQEVKAVIAIG